MAIHALPYQMETINELFSLLYAGHTKKGTEQGRANLKQCRRLDACLGQTRINSFGLMGEAQRVHRALAQGGVAPEALGSSEVSAFILTLCIFRGSQKKCRTAKQKTEPSLPARWGSSSMESYRPLSNASQARSMTG